MYIYIAHSTVHPPTHLYIIHTAFSFIHPSTVAVSNRVFLPPFIEPTSSFKALVPLYPPTHPPTASNPTSSPTPPSSPPADETGTGPCAFWPKQKEIQTSVRLLSSHPPTHPPIDSFIHPSIHPSSHSPTCSFIHPLTYTHTHTPLPKNRGGCSSVHSRNAGVRRCREESPSP